MDPRLSLALLIILVGVFAVSTYRLVRDHRRKARDKADKPGERPRR